MLSARSIDRLGWVCLGLALAFYALSFPLHCAALAAWVGGFSLLDGFVLGTALALATRTRRPVLIYACLAIALLTLWPLVAAWPPGDAWDVHPWRGAPVLIYNYFDVLRPCLYLLGSPYPFARFGHHAPDAEASPAEKGKSEDSIR